jgi:hypothetical protein
MIRGSPVSIAVSAIRQQVSPTMGGAVMRYAMLVCNDENAAVGPEESSATFAAFAAFAEEMEARGVLVAKERLRPTSTATTVRVRNGDVVVADGPFAETKEQIAGFYLMECKDLDEAIEIAAKIPGAAFGTIEVRPVWEI